MHPRPLVVALTAALVLSVLPLPASGQLHWAIAKRSDEEILSRIPKLLERLDQTPGATQAPVVILEKGHNFRLERHPPEEFGADTFRFLGPKSCLNQVFLVRDPSSVPSIVTQPHFDPEARLIEVAAFHVRNGKLTRLEDKWQEQKGDGHVQRGVVTLQFPELQKGDVVGYSLVTESDAPLFLASLAATDRVPVVYYSLRVLANGAVTYAIDGKGFTEVPKVKSAETKNARPSAWQVSCTSLAAVPDLALSGPYGADVPHFDVTATAVHFQSESMGFAEWAPVTNWNLALANLPGASRLKTDGLDVRVSVMTTGASSPLEKFEKITTYVRDQIRLLEGDRYDPHGLRPTSREILEAGEASALEKAVLTLAMLEAAGVPAQLTLAHPNRDGAVDEQGSLIQFPEQVVRLQSETAVYFAPQCTECPLGTLPPAWEGAILLVPSPDLETLAQDFYKKHTEAAMREGRFSPQRLMSAMEGEKWYTLESVAAAAP